MDELDDERARAHDLIEAIKDYIGSDHIRSSLFVGLLLGSYWQHPDWRTEDTFRQVMAAVQLVSPAEVETIRKIDEQFTRMRELRTKALEIVTQQPVNNENH